MILETWRITGPNEATGYLELPKREFAYRLLSLALRLQMTSLVPAAQVFAQMDILDGDGLISQTYAVDQTQAPGVVTGQFVIWNFAPISNAISGPGQAFGNIWRLGVPIPPELWILPQSQIRLSIIGAQAGGGSGGGDFWVDNTLSIARL